MRRATLLFNPAAGRGRQRRQMVEAAAAALTQRGVETEVIATESPDRAGAQALDACARGADAVFACGGDGTLHAVLQGMILHSQATQSQAGPSQASLGVIPLGSANVLARHLRLPRGPAQAALRQLDFTPTMVPAGRLAFTSADGATKQRYFLVVAGAGPDGALVYRMLASGKQRWGRAMYYARAAHLFAREHFSTFRVHCQLANGEQIERDVVSAMCARVSDLGGVFSPLLRGGQLLSPHLRVSLVRAPAHMGLPAWFAMSWAGLHRFNRFAETLDVASFTCEPGNAAPVQVQADGEWLGRTPMHVSLEPNGVRLLLPPGGD